MLNIGIKLAASRDFPDHPAPPSQVALRGRWSNGTHVILHARVGRETSTPLYGKVA